MGLKQIADFVLNYWVLIVAGNLVGAVFGYYYYWDSLVANPWYYWPWIPVSPNACLFMMVVLYLHFKTGRRRLTDLFGVLAFIGNFKYGLWTIIVVWFEFEGFAAAVSPEYYILIALGHLLMVFQAFLLFRFVSFDGSYLVYSFLWFLSNDLFDYSGPMLHSWIPETASVSLAMSTAYALTFFSVLVWVLGHHILLDN